MSEDWSREEVDQIVSDYFSMLSCELQNIPYIKRAHRLQLLQRLNGRNESAIERKHQNISAVLVDLDAPIISGYKPLKKYQKLLLEAVTEFIESNPVLIEELREIVDRPLKPRETTDILNSLVDPPEMRSASRKPQETTEKWLPIVRKVNFVAREAKNRAVGDAGEQFIMEYEHARLCKEDRMSLANCIEHVSRTQGDGLGFDIRSFELDGRERWIEVKTTSFCKFTPFYLSQNELQCSQLFPERYWLYRVFSIRDNPQFFQIGGAMNLVCRLTPIQYSASVGL